jgi:hypothetical protein
MYAQAVAGRNLILDCRDMTRFFERRELYPFRPLMPQLPEAGQQLRSADARRNQGRIDDLAILNQRTRLAADQMADDR